jgi:hypothetical protein
LSTPATPPGTPTLPLSPALRTAYEQLYDACETASEATADEDLLEGLNDAQLAIGGVLSADNEYRLSQDDAKFQALAGKIDEANDSLTELQGQIAGIAGKIAAIGSVASGIAKVIGLVGGA